MDGCRCIDGIVAGDGLMYRVRSFVLSSRRICKICSVHLKRTASLAASVFVVAWVDDGALAAFCIDPGIEATLHRLLQRWLSWA